MAINFPDSPSVNDTHTVGDRTWVWDGTTWNVLVGGVPTSISEFSVTGDLYVGQNAEIDGTLTANHIHGNIAGSVYLHVKNTSGSEIAAGTPVYATGSVGASGATEIAPSDASTSGTMPAVGITQSTLAINAEGHATILGVIGSQDTSTYSLNQPLYVAPGGGLTATRPTAATDAVQSIARVIRVDASSGELLVMGAGRTNDVPNEISILGDLTVDTDTLFVDSTNNRVGIGTTSPTGDLDINGNTSALVFTSPSNTNRYRIDANMTDAADYGLSIGYWDGSAFQRTLTVDDGGNVGIGNTTPSKALDVVGDIGLTGEIDGPSDFTVSNGQGEAIEFNQTNNSTYIKSLGVTRLTVDGSGLVTTSSDIDVLGGAIDLKGSDASYPNSLNFYANDGSGAFWHMSAPRQATSDDFKLYWYDGSSYGERFKLTTTGNTTIAGTLTVSGDQITMAGSNSRDKYRVWNSSYYTIGMESAHNFGALGDYAMTFQMNSDANRGWWWGDTSHTNSQGAMSLTTIGQLTIANSIRVGFGESDTTAPGISSGVQANGGFYSNSSYVSRPGASATGFYLNPQLPNTGGGRALDIRACSDSSSAPFQFLTGNSFAFVTDGTTRLTISNAGISKSGGTFDIQHPLDADDSTSRLRHGFVESPYNDNMYRGTVVLDENGQAVIDLDSHYGMRDGTWVALNTNPWVIASVNGGSPVAWNLVGKTLTLTGTTGESVQWLVIGERHDAHVMSEKNTATDENGRLILEYTREWEDEDGWTPPHLLGESVE